MFLILIKYEVFISLMRFIFWDILNSNKGGFIYGEELGNRTVW